MWFQYSGSVDKLTCSSSTKIQYLCRYIYFATRHTYGSVSYLDSVVYNTSSFNQVPRTYVLIWWTKLTVWFGWRWSIVVQGNAIRVQITELFAVIFVIDGEISNHMTNENLVVDWLFVLDVTTIGWTMQKEIHIAIRHSGIGYGKVPGIFARIPCPFCSQIYGGG